MSSHEDGGSGAAKKKIETLKIIFAGTNLPAARQALATLHKLTPERFRGGLDTIPSGRDTLLHMEFRCYGLQQTSFRNAVTVHLWGISDNASGETWSEFIKDASSLAYFITPDIELAKQSLISFDALLKQNGGELKKTPLLILPPPGDEPFEPMARKLDRPVRNLFDSEPDSGYRLYLAVRILINRHLPEQPPRPMGAGGAYSYQSSPPPSSLFSSELPEGMKEEDLFLPPDDAISRGESRKKSSFQFSEEKEPPEERRRGLFGRVLGKKKDK